MTSKQPQDANQQDFELAEPFSRIFVNRAEADWAFDFLREATRRLKVTDPYDPRVAVTVSTRSGKPFLHFNFGNWLVLGFRAPGPTPTRVDIALLADRVSWDERFTSFVSDRKEGEPEVRSYELPIETVRPLTSHLQQTFEATLDFIADKFASWKRSPHWKQHNPEIIEALFDPEKREQLFASGLPEPELRYERHLTAFHLEAAEEEGVYEEDVLVPGEDVLDQAEGNMNLEGEEPVNVTSDEQILAEPFSRIFVDREEAEWAFDFLRETCDLLGIESPDDPRFAIVLARRYGGLNLHFDFGSWLVLGFREPGLRIQRIRIPFIADQVGFEEDFVEHSFVQDSDEPTIVGYGLPIEFLKGWDNTLKEVYNSTLERIATRFRAQERCPWHRYHQPEIAEAVFNLEKRIKLLTRGLQQETPTVTGEELEKGFDQMMPDYPLSHLADETGFEEDTLSRWVRAIERKRQAILYGPPGTGKTFIAEGLAKHLIGGGDGFVELVQFHPAYAYEDFMQGLRPIARSEGGLDYRMVPGRFLEFCRKSQKHEGRCILIIDEINRANLARVFGELMYLLEYRNREVPLAGGGTLKIPHNVRLIGTMNTADRSIALVDHALRRRFAFIALRPNYQVLRQYHQREETGFPIERLIKALTRLNGQIEADYQVGITFFMRQNLADEIEDIWRMEIEPYLEEYFFDQRSTVDDYRWAEIKQEIFPE